MTARVSERITQWSFSRWETYTQCPAKARFKYLLKLPDPSGPAAERGTQYHKLAEDFVLKKLPRLPVELKDFHQEFTALRAARGVKCEMEWAFTAQWQPTGWFDRDCWARIKTDVLRPQGTKRAAIVDHKTGKIREDKHQKQLKLYAVGGFYQYPKLEAIDVELWYLDHQHILEGQFTREQLPELQQEWEALVQPMLTERRFKPTPSADSCKWCPYAKDKGGPCRFHSNGR